MFIPGHVQLCKHRFRLGQLSLSAIYQDHIRNFIFINRFTIATAQDLIHRRVVIARGDAGDIIAPVLRTQRTIAVKHHAGRHGLLAHGVADVKALHSLHGRQFQHGGQRLQALMNGRLLSQFRG